MLPRAVIALILALSVGTARAQNESDREPSKPDGISRVEALLEGRGEMAETASKPAAGKDAKPHKKPDYPALLFVFVLATFIGLGVVARVSRLLHTPLMSLTNAISAIAVIGSIIVAGADYPPTIRMLGVVALFASTTNLVSGFLITDRMLKMFKQTRDQGKP